MQISNLDLKCGAYVTYMKYVGTESQVSVGSPCQKTTCLKQCFFGTHTMQALEHVESEVCVVGGRVNTHAHTRTHVHTHTNTAERDAYALKAPSFATAKQQNSRRRSLFEGSRCTPRFLRAPSPHLSLKKGMAQHAQAPGVLMSIGVVPF